MAIRRWVPIVLGVVVLLVIAMGALVGSCAYMVRKQVDVRQSASPADYDRAAADVRARFTGVPTLVEDGPSGPRISEKALTERQARRHTAPLTNLQVLVYSSKERKLVRFAIPFFLLRLSPDGKLDINRDDVGLEHMRLSIADLDAAGPGPLFMRERDDTRVLVWTE